MAKTPTQIRIDAEVKQQANILFKSLGLDLSSAVNLFLYQCILHGGLPFKVEVPQYSNQTLEAMNEAKRISKDAGIKGYTNIEDLKKALDEE